MYYKNLKLVLLNAYRIPLDFFSLQCSKACYLCMLTISQFLLRRLLSVLFLLHYFDLFVVTKLKAIKTDGNHDDPFIRASD